MCDKWHREAEMKSRRVAHQRIARGQIRVDRERRLHESKCRYDHPPDAFDGIERQDSLMSLYQPPHHLGFARRAESRCARILASLDGNETIDDLAALDQKLVHRLINAV